MRFVAVIAAAFLVAPGGATAGLQGNVVGKRGASAGAALTLDCPLGAGAVDSSGNGNHGTNTNVTTVTSPWAGFGQAYSFNGTDSKITAGTTLTNPVAVAKYMRLSGASGVHASTPDTAANSVTGDPDIRVKAALADWTPSADQSFVGKFPDAGDKSYVAKITSTGLLRLIVSSDGSATIGYNSTVATGVADGSTKWAKYTLDVDNGSGNSVATFFLSDNGTDWTQLGSPVTGAVTSIHNSATALFVGARANTGTQENATGKIYIAEVRNGIDGPVVAKFDATDGTPGSATLVSSATGETWTLNGAAAIIDQEQGPFTLEVRAKRASGSDRTVAGVTKTSTPSFRIYLSGSTRYRALVARATDGTEPPAATQESAIIGTDAHNIAIEWDSVALRGYLDGTMFAANAWPHGIALPVTATAFAVGAPASGGGFFDGIIDEVRLSKVARYAGSNYTPDAGPFVADANTQLLYHGEPADCTASETLTFTAATPRALCMSTGATEDTHVSEPAANVPCLNSTHGARAIGAIKNELCGSETLDDSVCDWISVTGAASTTLNTDDSPRSGTDTLSDTVTDDSMVVAEYIRSAITNSNAGRYRYSKWLRHTSAITSTLQVEADTAVTPTTQTCNASVLTTNKRFECVLDATGLTFTTVESRLYPRVSTDGALTGDVFAFGAQTVPPNGNSHEGRFPVPYCPSTGASATTCTAEVWRIPDAEEPRESAGTIAVDFTPMWGTGIGLTSVVPIWWTNGVGLFVANASTLRTSDGTTNTDLAFSNAAFTMKRVGTEWIGGTKKTRNHTEAGSATGSYDGSFGFASSNTLLGANESAPAASGWGWFKNLKFYSKPKANP